MKTTNPVNGKNESSNVIKHGNMDAFRTGEGMMPTSAVEGEGSAVMFMVVPKNKQPSFRPQSVEPDCIIHVNPNPNDMKVIGITAPAVEEMEEVMMCCCTCGMTCASITGGIICLFMSLPAFGFAYEMENDFWLLKLGLGFFGFVWLCMMILNFIVLCISNSDLYRVTAIGNIVCTYSMYVFDGIMSLLVMFAWYSDKSYKAGEWMLYVMVIVISNAILVTNGLCIFSRLGELQFAVAENLRKKEENHQKENHQEEN